MFLADGDRRAFLEVLGEVVERFAWRCHAYCLMPNQYHLLVETVEPTLSRGMRHLNGVYTQGFNRRHGRAGHVFQGRFKAILVEKGAHLLEVARYIVLNPVRAALAYRAFVEGGRDVSVWSHLRSGVFLGNEGFIEKLKPRLREKVAVREIPRGQRSAGRPSLADLFSTVGDKASRDERIHQAVRVHGYTLREVAEFLGLCYTTVSVIARRVADARRHQE